MPRGGSGYGEEGHRAIVNAWGEADYRDIMAGVDHLIAKGIADRDRLGVFGASYGGFMTNWIVTQTSRFKAASSSASISELDRSLLPGGCGAVMEEYFGKPWANRASYSEHSPLTHVENVQHALAAAAWRKRSARSHRQRAPLLRSAQGTGTHRRVRCVSARKPRPVPRPVAQQASMQRNVDWFLRWITPNWTRALRGRIIISG